MSHLLLVAMIAAQSLDISTTVIGLSKGCHEQTFYLQNAAQIASAKGGMTVALSFSLPILAHKNPKSAKTAAWVMIASGLGGGALNLRTMPTCRR